MKHCFYTSFNKSYSGQAILLASSLRRIYGNSVDIVALMVDELEENEVSYFSIFDSILLASELNIPNFRQWVFGLNIVEAATAVKPFALCELLKQYDHVTYLDPDIFVYSALDEILLSNDHWDISLTPHQTLHKSERWLIESTELESLKFGVYNLGFLSVRSTNEGKRIAEWWRARCYEYCLINVERGIFTDQKFFDSAPALFNGVRILRHPGYNVATWNLTERMVKLENNTLLSNEQPLRFCHFTKATHIGAFAMERMLSGSNMFEELFYSYLARLSEKKLELSGLSLEWKYGFYDDGMSIDNESRQKFRNLGKKRFDLDNPFSLNTRD
jgi:hypothetical protein